jgi:hypothetical protein
LHAHVAFHRGDAIAARRPPLINQDGKPGEPTTANDVTVSSDLADKSKTEKALVSAKSCAASSPRRSLDTVCNRAATTSTGRHWEICRRKRHDHHRAAIEGTSASQIRQQT